MANLGSRSLVQRWILEDRRREIHISSRAPIEFRYEIKVSSKLFDNIFFFQRKSHWDLFEYFAYLFVLKSLNFVSLINILISHLDFSPSFIRVYNSWTIVSQSCFSNFYYSNYLSNVIVTRNIECGLNANSIFPLAEILFLSSSGW